MQKEEGAEGSRGQLAKAHRGSATQFALELHGRQTGEGSEESSWCSNLDPRAHMILSHDVVWLECSNLGCQAVTVQVPGSSSGHPWWRNPRALATGCGWGRSMGAQPAPTCSLESPGSLE